MAKLTIDKESCIGCELCVISHPKIFQMKEGKAYSKKKDVSGNDLESAKNAKELCPVTAIKVE